VQFIGRFETTEPAGPKASWPAISTSAPWPIETATAETACARVSVTTADRASRPLPWVLREEQRSQPAQTERTSEEAATGSTSSALVAAEEPGGYCNIVEIMNGCSRRCERVDFCYCSCPGLVPR
jgi:hypothetical protein